VGIHVCVVVCVWCVWWGGIGTPLPGRAGIGTPSSRVGISVLYCLFVPTHPTCTIGACIGPIYLAYTIEAGTLPRTLLTALLPACTTDAGLHLRTPTAPLILACAHLHLLHP
jgi:hypothetical protein